MSVGKEAAAAQKVGLPPTSFLYTIDQICTLIAMNQDQAMRTIFYFYMRSTGAQSPHLMMARDISPPNHQPEWRVAEAEFVRWLKLKGYEINYIPSVRR